MAPPLFTPQRPNKVPISRTRANTARFDEALSDLWMHASNASPDLISTLDKHHRIVDVNTSMARAMGCTPEEARGKRCYHLLHRKRPYSRSLPTQSPSGMRERAAGRNQYGR